MPCWSTKSKKGKSTVDTSKQSKSSVISFEDKTKSRSPTQSVSLSAKLDSRLKEWISIHPFKTKLILQEIFSNLSVNELLVARTVSKLWNTAACYVLRRKIEGAIILQRGLSYYTRVMSKSLDIPVGRLFLKIDNMEDPSIIRFLEVVGPSIIFLVLNLEGSCLASFLGQMHNLKNLEQLSLNLFQEEDHDFQQYRKRKATSIKIFIEDFDKPKGNVNGFNLDHLESFVLSCEPEWRSNEALLLEKLLEMSPSLKNLNLGKWPFLLKPNTFNQCEFQSLKFLSLKILDDEACHILSKKKLPFLKTIEFELSNDLTQDNFQAFLENISNTLEYIEINNQYDLELDFELPSRMNELITIRLSKWIGRINLDSILVNAPKLEKLQLSHVNPSNILARDFDRKAQSVRYLAVNFGSGSHPMKKIFKVLRSFVSAFPNLKIFMMKKVSDKLLEIICEGWPHLEALRLTTSFALTDSGITGIPASGLQRMVKGEYRMSCDCCVPFPVGIDGKPQLDKERVVANIASLKKLKDLRIESEIGTNWTLTNYSLHLGIADLTCLENLKLSSKELGPHWCLKCIADSFPYLQHLSVMDRSISHDRYDEQELTYLLRKLPKLSLSFTAADGQH